MRTQSVLFVLLFTICYMLGTSQSVFFGDFNLQGFLKTREPIWTFNTTSVSKRLCVVTIPEKESEERIAYKFMYYDQSAHKVSLEMEGKFRKSSGMYAGPRGKPKVYVYKVAYYDKLFQCAVIKISPVSTTYGKPWYELQVWDMYLERREPSMSCREHFHKVARHGHAIYNPTCHNILPKMSPPAQKALKRRNSLH
ncbi:uncharacterized protein LOC119373783 [Rhipicephalus sanguineus]|uniref:uncharacterized protein LOC119373783 n=1 Tax=Rhipicephalus sanguineus TaxID=34632 RepID=UPI001895D59E|nr:uncharacterized protein LOC119373783 [Rhipicephalus sanguineus]